MQALLTDVEQRVEVIVLRFVDVCRREDTKKRRSTQGRLVNLHVSSIHQPMTVD